MSTVKPEGSASVQTKVFVKVSGDLLIPDTQILAYTLEWIQALVLTENSHTTICVGGGTQINNALRAKGFELREHGVIGRELKTAAERRIAEEELAKSLRLMMKKIVPGPSSHSVIMPVLNLGNVSCHVNGDTMVTVAYLGFDVLYVLTTQERVKKKKKHFAHLSKVRIVGF